MRNGRIKHSGLEIEGRRNFWDILNGAKGFLDGKRVVIHSGLEVERRRRFRKSFGSANGLLKRCWGVIHSSLEVKRISRIFRGAKGSLNLQRCFAYSGVEVE